MPALNTASLLAQVREARKASLATQGFRAVDPATNAVDPTSVKALYNYYVGCFIGDKAAQKVGLEEIENALKDQLNAVLSLVSSKKTYDFPLDIAKILDENKLADAPKKGNEAYKFYVRKIVSELNNLHEILTSARRNLSQLQTLLRQEDFENPAVRELLTHLRIAEIDGEAIKKAFSEYMVPKNFGITYMDVYTYNGEAKPAETASTPKSAAKGSDAYTMPEATEINWNKEKDWKNDKKLTFPSKIPDNISSVDDLYTKIKTDKLTGTRVVYTIYYKEGSTTVMTDRYDPSASVRYEVQDEVEQTENTPLSFFGELPLLDKLKYIVLYYTKSGTRRIFPEDPDIGFPCLSNPAPTGTNPVTDQDRKYTDDVNEIAHLEPFYIGYLVDRDGPVNALASFMEIKATAINEQIKVLGYRIKALRYYLRFLNRGLEEVNKSQSNGNARIPNSAYQILCMIGCNPTRLLKSMTFDGVTKDYFFLQWNGRDGKKTYHQSPNNKYMLVPADDEGMEAFIKNAGDTNADDGTPVAVNYAYDHIFNDGEGRWLEDDDSCACAHILLHLNGGLMPRSEWSDYWDNRKKWYLRNCEICCMAHGNGKLSWHYKYDWFYKKDKEFTVDKLKPFPADCPLRIITETDESKLPRELETNRINITSLLNENHNGNTWYNYKDASIWPSIVKNWQTTYDTAVGNIQSQLESVNKSIESLRNKIDTFNSSASNFRNKAYTIYNKTVSKIE